MGPCRLRSKMNFASEEIEFWNASSRSLATWPRRTVRLPLLVRRLGMYLLAVYGEGYLERYTESGIRVTGSDVSVVDQDRTAGDRQA